MCKKKNKYIIHKNNKKLFYEVKKISHSMESNY